MREGCVTGTTYLRRCRVGRFLDLVRSLFRESDGEESEEVTVGSFDVDVSLDQSLPLSDERSELVGGEVHTVDCETRV